MAGLFVQLVKFGLQRVFARGGGLFGLQGSTSLRNGVLCIGAGMFHRQRPPLSCQRGQRIWGLRQGARDYIVKPVDPQELLAKIAALA